MRSSTSASWFHDERSCACATGAGVLKLHPEPLSAAASSGRYLRQHARHCAQAGRGGEECGARRRHGVNPPDTHGCCAVHATRCTLHAAAASGRVRRTLHDLQASASHVAPAVAACDQIRRSTRPMRRRLDCQRPAQLPPPQRCAISFCLYSVHSIS